MKFLIIITSDSINTYTLKYYLFKPQIILNNMRFKKNNFIPNRTSQILKGNPFYLPRYRISHFLKLPQEIQDLIISAKGNSQIFPSITAIFPLRHQLTMSDDSFLYLYVAWSFLLFI